MGLKNAATSRILVNPAVFLIFTYFCVNVRSMLNTFHWISLSCKSILLFEFFFHSWPEIQSASLPQSGVRPLWWLQMQSISFPGRVEGLKSAANSRSLGNRG